MGAPAQVIHVTDTHLFADPAAALKERETDRTLRRVIARARSAVPAPDLVLATGDLAHDGEPETYERLARHLEGFGCPVRWTPGNHDVRDVMARVLEAHDMWGPGVVDVGAWRVVVLDSSIPGETAGRLDEHEIARLRAALETAPERPAMVALHHPPVPCGTPAMDAIALLDPDPLLDALRGAPNARAVVWGHFHHASELTRWGLKLWGTPSTCYQMRLGGDDVEIDDAPPACRIISLYPDGALQARVLHAAAAERD